MILVAPIFLLNSGSHRLQYETYRLINTVYKESTAMAVCERLSDQLYADAPVDKYGRKVQARKGDLFTTELHFLRVVVNNTNEEEEKQRERDNYLRELGILVGGKKKNGKASKVS